MTLFALSLALMLWTPNPLAREAESLGYGAETLAAAGLTAAHAQGMLAELAEAAEPRGELAALEAQVTELTHVLAQRTAACGRDPFCPVRGGELNGAREQYAQALAAAESLRASLRAALTQGMAAETVQRLEGLRARAGLRLPAEYRALPWADEQMEALAVALLAAARAERHGESLPPEQAALIAQADGHAAVIEARMDLDQNLSLIRQVMD